MSSPPYKSTQPFEGCQEGQALRLNSTPEPFHLHLVNCPKCDQAQKEIVQFKALTQSARRILGEVQPVPTDASWAHFRVKLEAKLSDDKPISWWASWRLAAAVLCLLLVGFGAWITLAKPLATLEAHQVAALNTIKRPEVQPSFEHFYSERTFAFSEHGRALATREGDTLQAGQGMRTVSIDQRHHVTLWPGSELEVLSLGFKGVSLALKKGEAYFEVTRAKGEGLFQVKALEHTVEVVGTRFQVAIDDTCTGAKVSVSEGKVRIVNHLSKMPQTIEAGASLHIGDVTDSKHEAEPATLVESAQSPSSREHQAPIKAATSRRPVAQASVASNEEVETLAEGFKLARLGRCVQALAIIREPLASKHGATAREALWLAAYCQRRLGNIERSQQLFDQYGTRGPLPFPEGSSLPPLP